MYKPTRRNGTRKSPRTIGNEFHVDLPKTLFRTETSEVGPSLEAEHSITDVLDPSRRGA